MLLLLARKSLRQRRLTSTLTVVSIALSVCLFLGVDMVRMGARESFTGAISGTDLIVAPRSSVTQIALYTLFGIGSGVGGMSTASWERIDAHPAVEWTAPLAFGDSYRGYRVVGANEAFYERYRFAGGRRLAFAVGAEPDEDHAASLGSAVAEELGLSVGDEMVLAHGVQEHGFLEHADHPFRVVGVLEPTNTPVDRSVYITLEGVAAMHDEEDEDHHEDVRLSAVLVGLRSRPDVLRVKREIDESEAEPLTAAMPAVALNEVWSALGYAERALNAVSVAVVGVGLMSMLIALYSTLQERRREIAVLRSIGLGRREVVSLLIIEAGLLSGGGVVFGLALTYAALFFLQPLMEAGVGLYLPIRPPTLLHAGWLACLLVAGMAIGVVPAWRAYRTSLADGLAVRL